MNSKKRKNTLDNDCSCLEAVLDTLVDAESEDKIRPNQLHIELGPLLILCATVFLVATAIVMATYKKLYIND